MKKCDICKKSNLGEDALKMQGGKWWCMSCCSDIATGADVFWEEEQKKRMAFDKTDK